MTPREQVLELARSMRVGLVKIGKQVTGELFHWRNNALQTEELVGACALGCVYMAALGKPEPVALPDWYSDYDDDERSDDEKKSYDEDEYMRELRENFPVLGRTGISWPVVVDRPDSYTQLESIITILNDSHGWTIDQIADYLEQEVAPTL